MSLLSMVPLIASFGVVAFLYGSVGLGGGSSYIAMMALWDLPQNTMRVIALSLNLIVASGGLWHFARQGHFPARHFVPLAVTSVPAAFFAARINLSRVVFQRLIGVLLIVAGGRMLLARQLKRKERAPLEAPRFWVLALLGLLLGTIAGLTGIGGGIYLGPVLVLGRFLAQKDASGISAAFIIANSISGLAGRLLEAAAFDWALFLPAAVITFGCGHAGAYLGARRWQPETIQTVFGLIVLAVSIRLLVKSYGI